MSGGAIGGASQSLFKKDLVGSAAVPAASAGEDVGALRDNLNRYHNSF